MAKNEAKSTESTEIDFSAFQEEQVGFPPYWNPEEGKQFYALPISRDERDPDFHRYVLQAFQDVDCQIGPSDDAETVKVKKGEFFTCSTYAALPLELYALAKTPVLVSVKKKRELKGNKELWIFSVALAPADKKRLDSVRTELMAQLGALPSPSNAEA